MSARFYVDAEGNYIGSFDGALPPAGAVEVPAPPESAVHIWDGEKFLPALVDLIEYAAEVRYQKETAGVLVAGAIIPTSRSDQSMITGAHAYAIANPGSTIDFKSNSGWVELTAAQMVAIGQAVGAHVQACFTAEKLIDADIEGGLITTTAEIDNDIRWP